MSAVNRQFRLANRPVGMPERANFSLVTEALPELAEGQVLVRVRYLSLDPAMRGWMHDAPSYVPPVGIGEVMRALGAGQVAATRNPSFAEGDWVSGALGAQEYALSDGKGLTPLDVKRAPVELYMSALGMQGLTAYFGLLEVGKLAAGETVVVSAAAGAVGSVVGQIARLKGARAVGIAGGPEKCRYVREELGFDACVDYRAPELRAQLKAACPDGIHVYFDNVGGEILDTALSLLARGARVVICGAISQYTSGEKTQGPSNYMALLVKRATMQGFVVFDYAARYAEALKEMGGWVAAGKLKSKVHLVEGFDAFPDALQMLFKGDNFGKLLLRLG